MFRVSGGPPFKYFSREFLWGAAIFFAVDAYTIKPRKTPGRLRSGERVVLIRKRDEKAAFHHGGSLSGRAEPKPGMTVNITLGTNPTKAARINASGAPK